MSQPIDDALRENIKAFLRVREGAGSDDYPWSQLNSATDILRKIDTALDAAPAPKVK